LKTTIGKKRKGKFVVKVSEVCPFCKKPVQGPFSLIVMGFWSYLKGYYNKVHPRCVLQGASFVTGPPGMAQSYGGFQGRWSDWKLRSFGREGASLIYGDLDFMWAKTTPWEQERALTGKILMSYNTPRLLWGRFTQGYNPRLLLIQTILGTAMATFLVLVLIYLTLTNPYSNFTLLLLPLILACLVIAVITVMGIRSITGAKKFFANQPF
jgi:hypothetical protein